LVFLQNPILNKPRLN